MTAPHIFNETEIEWDSKAHRVFNLTDDPLKKDSFPSTGHVPIKFREHVVAGGLWTEIGFSVWAAGSGVVATAPPFGPLMIAAGLDENVDAGVSVTYDCDGALKLNTTAVDIDIAYGDLLKIECNDTVMNMIQTFRPGEPVETAFEGAGTYTVPTEAAITASIETKAHPVAAKGLTVTLANETLVMKECVLNLGNENNSPNYDIAATNGVQKPIVTDTDPTVEILALIPATGTADYFSDFISEAKLAFSLVLGSVAGNIMTVTADLYLRDYTMTTVDGIAAIRLIGEHSWTSGETQLQWVFI